MPADPALRRRLSNLPGQLLELVHSGRISGAVTLLWQGGKIVQQNALGWRDIGAGLPMRQDTIFRIASMTKPITSVAALMLVEQDRMGLDDSIVKWLPEFAEMRVLRDPAGPLDAVEPARREITVRDLMTHRAGLAYAFTASGPIARAYDEAFGEVPKIRMTPGTWLRAIAALPLLHQPGERMHYSHATEILGYLVERVAGIGYYDFLRERILDPLGMKDTAFHVPSSARDRLAKLYASENGLLHEVDVAIPAERPIFCAGGGMLVSTASDYLTFARMLLGGGSADGIRILEPETVAMMRTNQLTPAQREIPFLGNPYWNGMGFGLGLGVVTDPTRHAWMGPGNTGAFTWPGIWGTWWQADPVLDAVMIYLIQNATPLGPPAIAQIPSSQRLQPRPGLELFQKAVYG